jgi:hypothetical protein
LRLTLQRPDKFRRFALTLCLIAAGGGLLVPAARTAFAQSATATLGGVIVDDKGAVVPAVKVTLTSAATKFARETVTDENGQFTFALLPPGGYTLATQRDGFAPARVNDLNLNVNDQRAVRLQLRVGSVTAAVDVTGEASLVDESPAVSTVVDRQFVANLPLNGRSFQSLIVLTPGVVLTKSNFAELGQFSVNGQRPNANYFTVDGVSANFGAGLGQGGAGAIAATTSLGTTNNLVSVDALQEFRIQTSTYAPEFGRTPGAQVSLITRSGTNQYHWTLFEYFRNEKLDANDWFGNRSNLSRPPMRHNQFGGVLGGPLALPRRVFGPLGYEGRDRSFFFFSYEGMRVRQPQFAIVSVPSLAARQRASALLKPLMDAFPLPNGGDLGNDLAQFAASYSNPFSIDATSLRLDHSFSDRLSLFARLNHAPSQTARRAGALVTVVPTRWDTGTATLGVTQTFSASVNNETRLNFSRHQVRGDNEFDPLNGAVRPTDEQLAALYGGLRPGENVLLRVTIFGGTTPLYSFGKDQEDLQRQFNLVDNLSVVRGAHQLKFGVDYRYLWPRVAPAAIRVLPNFNGVAGFLSGRTTSMNVTGNEVVDYVFHNFSAYAQDTWKAGRRLTLTYGLRYEVNPPPRGRGGRELYTFRELNDPAAFELAPGGTPFYETRWLNFAPRVGAAYQLRGRAGWETMLRGGFGVFYDLGVGASYGLGAQFGFPYQRIAARGAQTLPFSTATVTPLPVGLNPPWSGRAADPDLRLPRTYQFNLAVEQSLGARQTLTATYVGALGRKLLRAETYSSPNPRVTLLTVTRNQAESDYHALQLQFQRRLSRGLQALVSHTWSHSIDNASRDSFAFPRSDRLDPRTDRGPSDFDVRHSFSAAVTYDLPAPAQTAARALFGRWSTDVIFLARGGTPLDVTGNRDLGFGGFGVRPDLVPGVPVWVDDPAAPGGRRINNARSATNANQVGAFAVPRELRQGTLGRNALRGFGFHQVNFALRREFAFTERLKLQFRAEFFNLFNRPNFADPNVNLGSTNAAGTLNPNGLFGQSAAMLNRGLSDTIGGGALGGNVFNLYQVGGPRSIQFALRLQY